MNLTLGFSLVRPWNPGRIDSNPSVVPQFTDQANKVALSATDFDNLLVFDIITVNKLWVTPVMNFTKVGEKPCWSSYPWV